MKHKNTLLVSLIILAIAWIYYLVSSAMSPVEDYKKTFNEIIEVQEEKHELIIELTKVDSDIWQLQENKSQIEKEIKNLIKKEIKLNESLQKKGAKINYLK